MDDIKIDITLHTAYHKMTFISGDVEWFTLKIMILIGDFKIGLRVTTVKWLCYHALFLRIWLLLLHHYNIAPIRTKGSLNIISLCVLWLKVKICANQNMSSICDWPHHFCFWFSYLYNTHHHHVLIIYDEWM